MFGDGFVLFGDGVDEVGPLIVVKHFLNGVESRVFNDLGDHFVGRADGAGGGVEDEDREVAEGGDLFGGDGEAECFKEGQQARVAGDDEVERGVVQCERFQIFNRTLGGSGELAETREGEVRKAENPTERTGDGDRFGTGAGGDLVGIGEGIEDGRGEGDFEGVGEGGVQRERFGGGDFGEVRLEAGKGNGGIAGVVLVAANDIGAEDGAGTEEEARGFQITAGL